MAEKSIKAVIFGAGITGRQCIKEMVEDGVEVVGAVGNKSNIGKDVGELAGIGPLGILLEKDGEAVIKRTQPDIALICVDTESAYPLIEMCLKNKVNVATIAIELFYLYRTDPDKAAEFDKLAKDNGVTLYGTGIQDIHWQNLCTLLAASSRNITRIVGENWALVDDQSVQVADECYSGMTLDEFNKVNADLGYEPTAFTETMFGIADELGYHITEEIPERTPCIAKTDIYVEQLDRHIKKGDLAGFQDKVTLKTEEGVDLVCIFVEKVTEEGDTALNSWLIEGEPTLMTTTDDMHGEFVTSIGIESRIADVINAKPGYILCKDMPMPRYKTKPMAEYLD